MKRRRIALVIGILLAAGLVVFYIPVFNQPRERSSGNVSPESIQKREVFRAHMDEGREMLAARNGAAAEAAFRQALSGISPARSSEAEAGIAEALFLQGRTEEALEQYRNVVAESGDGDAELLLKYGMLLDRGGLAQEALAAWRRALQIQPPGTFPVQLSENAPATEVRQKAKQALALYEPPQEQ